jgi:hypothetical protein
MIAMRLLAAAGLIWSFAVPAIAQNKYAGPRPPKPDVVYLLHATELTPTEAGEAKEETRKDVVANVMKGAASTSRTPLAEPIFLIAAEKIDAEKFELYRMEVKNGQREVAIPSDPKKRLKNAPKPLRLRWEKIEAGLFRLEANEYLENGEYCLSPSGSQQVFCFQVY